MAVKMLKSLFMDGLTEELEKSVRELVQIIRENKLKTTANDHLVITVDDQISTMKSQSNLIIQRGDEVLAVASVKRKTLISGLEKYGPVVMLTSIIVAPETDLSGDLVYSALFDHMKRINDRVLVARTVSTNTEHLNLLKRNGFSLEKSVPQIAGGVADTQSWVRLI